jgi:hypothetical protein
LVIVLEQN